LNGNSPSNQRILMVVLAVLLASGPALAAPPNDDCAQAIEVFDGVPVNGTNDGATGAGQSSCAFGDGNDVWYFFTATEDVFAAFSLCGNADFDTTIALFDACGGNETACDDDGCGDLRSTMTVFVDGGATVHARIAGFGGDSGDFTLTVNAIPAGEVEGPDVIYSNIQSILSLPPVGGVRAYSLSSHTCNIGDQNLPWNPTSCLLATNAYRLYDGRLEQIGMAWLKNATGAFAIDGCGPPCNGQGGNVLGAGCLDIYDAGFNAGHSILGPRSQCNAFTGAYPGPSGGTGDSIFKRLQIAESDLDADNFPGATYFVEGVYVAAADAAAGNALNNASYRRATVNPGTFVMSPAGSVHSTEPALFAWRDHGLGVNMPDPSVTLAVVDVPNEGRFHVGAKVTDLGGGVWRYVYAVFNLNSNRSARSFRVPLSPGTVVTNVGFHDVDYHSGEPYDNTDWNVSPGPAAVGWSSPQTFGQNPNTNALRFATMYTFWFDADAAPSLGACTIGLFRIGIPATIDVTLPVPESCPADCRTDGRRDALDVQAYLDCLLGESQLCGCAYINGDPVAADIPDFVELIIHGNDCP